MSRTATSPSAPAAVVGRGRPALSDLVSRVLAVRRELLPFAAIGTIAFAARLVSLTRMPLHHDESEHAWFAWLLRTGHGYHYDPVFHGPLQFYLMTLASLVLGTTDFAARVAPALIGSLMTVLPFLLRRQIGRVAALTASIALCCTPSYLYFSRFAREDIYAACVTFGLFIVFLRFLDEPRRWHPPVFFGLLAFAFATKETAYITSFLLLLFVLGAVGVQAIGARRVGGRMRDAPLVRAAASLGATVWAWAVATFLLVFTLLFSTFLTNPSGLREGLVGSIRYWLSQQPVGRGGQPWFYYLILLPAYEWPLLIMAAVGVVSVVVRRNIAGAFLIWMAVGSLAVYSWASERMPWLVLHPLLPIILLAGIGLQSLVESRRRLGSRVLLGVAAIGAMASIYAAVAVAYIRPADPRELLVQVQTSDDVPKIRSELMRLEASSRRRLGRPLSLTVDAWGGTGWPWGWYLRAVPVSYDDLSIATPQADPDAVLVAAPNQARIEPLLRGYVAHRFRLRVWWVQDWGAAGVRDWARWLVARKAWGPTATMDEFLYLKPDLARTLNGADRAKAS
jgi:uncharacterized protein (TIGR03663 family)